VLEAVHALCIQELARKLAPMLRGDRPNRRIISVAVGSTLFDLLPEGNRSLGFGLTNPTPDPQACFGFNCRAAPVFASLIHLYALFFASLRPT